MGYAFLSTLSLRRATVLPEASPCTGRDFYPRSPCGERPRPRRRRRRGCYFYPRSPCGERRSSSRSWVVVFLFLSTLSLRRATQTNTGSNESGEFLSTLSLRRATNSLVRCSCTIDISIHALLAESDAWPVGISHHRRISIHALLAESDTSPAAAPFRLSTFLSTLSLRRATAQAWPVLPAGCHFYPRSPCGERPLCPKTQPSKPTFLSTLSLRRATFKCPVSAQINAISIHALLAESDQKQSNHHK